MPLSNDRIDFNKKSTALNKVKFFTLLLVFTLLTLVYIGSSPVLATEGSQSTSKVSIFDKFSSFIKAPLAQVVFAQANQKATPAPKPKPSQEGLLQKIWNFIAAPFQALVTPSAPAPTKTKTVQATPTVAPAAKTTTEIPSQGSTTGLTVVKTTTATPTASSIISSLNAGTTYVDLIGKSVIDSNGNIYPSGIALAQTDKPTLGTTTNKYYGLNLYQFSIDKVGGITTVLGGGVVKSSSKGVLSSSAIDVNSGDITGTIQAGNGGTGQSTYTVGDMLYSATAGNLSRLGIGASGQMLSAVGGIPAWSSSLSIATIYSSGNVGVGITTPNSRLTVNGGAVIGSGYNTTAPTDGLLVQGNVGLGVTTPGAGLALSSNAIIGFSGTNVPAPTSGLAVSGNVGIGVTTANSKLAVLGNLALGSGFAGMAAPTDGLIVQGNVGVGISVPSQLFQVGSAGSSLAFTSGGNLGVGVTTPLNTLDVVGSAQIRTAGAATFAVTSSNRVGVGTTAPGGTFSVSGNTTLGTFSSTAGPTNGLAVSGNVGIGITTANSALTVNGGAAIGSSFNVTAPTDGLIVQGNVGIGTTSPSQLFQVNYSSSNPFVVTSGGNVGIGTTTPGTTVAGSLLDVQGDNSSAVRIYLRDTNASGATVYTIGNDTRANSGGLALNGSSASAYGGANSLNLVQVTNNPLTLSTNNTVRMTILGGGNVGIGATLPQATFVIQGNVGIGYTGVNQSIPTNGLAVSGNVGVGVTTANSALTVVGGATIGGAYNLAAPTNGLLVQGLVGIGTTAPSGVLEISSDGNSMGGGLGTLFITGSSNKERVEIRSGGGNAVFQGKSSGGTYTVPTATTINTAIASLAGGGYDGSAWTGNPGLIAINAAENFTSTAQGTNITFATTQKTTTTRTERMRIDDVGNVGIGTSAPGTLLTVGATLGSQFLVASNGNVGIGVTTNSPLAALHVSGTTFLNGNVGIGTSTTGSYLLTVGGGAASQFRVDTNGNVGIGTTFAPGTYKLDVGGLVRATGFNGTCNVSTPASGNPLGCNQDVAEIYTSLEDVESGDVLVIDSGSNRTVRKSRGAYEPSLIGAVSTTPGLLLGIDGANVALAGEANEYQAKADPKKPAVALSGKIPVKVTGAVKSGDYLTSSSIPGVAMKATKAGPVIGQALEDYDGAAVGKVLTFARLGYFNGTSIGDLVSKEAIAAVSANYSQLVLESLLAEQKAALQAASASELLTDTIAAGVEVITPKLTADNVIAGLIKPLEGKNLTLALTHDQGFNITNDSNETVISFDNEGNAYFKGRVVAASVKADQIEGLRVLADAIVTSKISSLVDQKVSEATSSAKAVAGVATSAPTLDANILVRLNADGGLTVGGPAEFKSQSVFSAVSEFLSNVIFRGDVNFIGRLFLPKDSVGQAVIKAGSDAVTVSFARGYDSTPSVSVTPTMYAGNDGAGNSILSGDIRYVVQGLSTSGFTIKLNKAAPADIVFSWTALSQSNSFTSTQPASAPVAPAPVATPTPSASPTPQPTATPEPSATPVATPTPSASPTPQPTATPEPSATPVPTL